VRVDISPYAVSGKSGITLSFQAYRGGEAVSVTVRETSDGWPLLTAETEANIKVALPWFVHWACRVSTRYFVLLWLL
jgi:hypothetical protein